MKQLLFNSLLIFGSAFIYIQCVKVLIPASKLSKHQFQNIPKAHAAGDSKQNNTAFAITSASVFKLNFKYRIITPLFKDRASPYNMMAYFNYHSLFYNPYMGLNYSELIGNYKNASQGSKR